MGNVVYVVTSRDRGLISAHMKETDAMEAVKDQKFKEEMSGGSPSVWFQRLTLN